jgi:hypothetical protein
LIYNSEGWKFQYQDIRTGETIFLLYPIAESKREPTPEGNLFKALNPFMKAKPSWPNQLLVMLEWQLNFNVSFKQ